MTTTYASVSIIANGQPYVFTKDATDASSAANMVSVVSNRELGDTFPSGATITKIGPCILNSSDGTGASKSELGAVIVDPQNNVVYQAPYVDPETAPIDPMADCNIPVGLNYQMTIVTTNA